MTPLVETARIYLNEQRQGVITCAHCGLKRFVDMSNYTDNSLGGKLRTIQCSACGELFDITFDFRRYRRIDVNLPGKILHLPTRQELDHVVVVSLSINGVGFITSRNAIVDGENIYELVFHLDDADHSIIREEILVKRVNGLCVGAEFYQNDKYNYELDFYIATEP